MYDNVLRKLEDSMLTTSGRGEGSVSEWGCGEIDGDRQEVLSALSSGIGTMFMQADVVGLRLICSYIFASQI